MPVHRIIARLGAVPQRGLVEAFGVEFPSKDANALPNLSSQYECNVPGMYIIGALGGYPLIKQAMNQGYEVVEYILGNKINPADHPLLEEKFKALPYDEDVDGILAMMQTRIPVFSGVNPLMFREVMLDSPSMRRRKGRSSSRKTTTPTPSIRSSMAKCRLRWPWGSPSPLGRGTSSGR